MTQAVSRVPPKLWNTLSYTLVALCEVSTAAIGIGALRLLYLETKDQVPYCKIFKTVRAVLASVFLLSGDLLGSIRHTTYLLALCGDGHPGRPSLYRAVMTVMGVPGAHHCRGLASRWHWTYYLLAPTYLLCVVMGARDAHHWMAVLTGVVRPGRLGHTAPNGEHKGKNDIRRRSRSHKSSQSLTNANGLLTGSGGKFGSPEDGKFAVYRTPHPIELEFHPWILQEGTPLQSSGGWYRDNGVRAVCSKFGDRWDEFVAIVSSLNMRRWGRAALIRDSRLEGSPTSTSEYSSGDTEMNGEARIALTLFLS
ncbi:hypothetical protein B0H16DRAFT_1456116 [Mycena metata]|uniref:Uncharacterized protein n=1 Tax=Mycena metata TaxID=1033252 RepID=A0AAD7NI42_9AGAR|nr:hypothetical protein B0H16DRAFT_1456116 [Mycena metata]